MAFGDIERLNDDSELHRLLRLGKLDHKSKCKEGLDEVIGIWFGGQGEVSERRVVDCA